MTVFDLDASLCEFDQGVHVRLADIVPQIALSDDVAALCGHLLLHCGRGEDGPDPVGEPGGVKLEQLVGVTDHLPVEWSVEGKGWGPAPSACRSAGLVPPTECPCT